MWLVYNNEEAINTKYLASYIINEDEQGFYIEFYNHNAWTTKWRFENETEFNECLSKLKNILNVIDIETYKIIENNKEDVKVYKL